MQKISTSFTKLVKSYVDTGLAGKQNLIGYTPENVANKDNGALSTSTTTYPTSGAVKSYVDTGLAGKQNVLGYTPENIANKSTNTSLGTSDTLYPTQNAVKTYVDTGLAGKQNTLTYTPEDVANKSTNTALGGSNILYPTQNAVKTYVDTGLSGKQNTLGFTPEDVANKSTNTSLGTSNTLYPTQNAVKTYVDNAVISGSTPDATSTVKGKLKLAGDLSGTADLPTVPALANKANTSTTISTTTPLSGGGDLSANRTLSISQATTSTDGYLSSTDWNTFNNKQAALGFTPENVANKATNLTTPDNTKYPTTLAVSTELGTKQDTLVSGTNIKTINGSSVLGSGNLVVTGGGNAFGTINTPSGTDPVATTSADTLNLTSSDKFATIEGNAGTKTVDVKAGPYAIALAIIFG